jgi:hypothetical protein
MHELPCDPQPLATLQARVREQLAYLQQAELDVQRLVVEVEAQRAAVNAAEAQAQDEIAKANAVSEHAQLRLVQLEQQEVSTSDVGVFTLH